MTDTIESLRAERDAWKAELIAVIGNVMDASIDLNTGKTKSQVSDRLDEIWLRAGRFINRWETSK